MKNLLLITLLLLFTNFLSAQSLHHKLSVDVDLQQNSINVIDTLKIPIKVLDDDNSMTIYLNNNLELTSLDKQFELLTIDSESMDSSRFVQLKKYRIRLPKTENAFLYLPVQYSGIIKHEIVEGAAEYARGFSETSGIIFDKGVYLSGSTYWVPQVENAEMATFELTVKIDKGWNVVSQGTRVQNELVEDKIIITYESLQPMDEIYLIAAEWTEYSLQHNNVLVQAFLRTPNEELAQRYLGVTADYIRLYQELIGSYPYTKFALVENFWETGYGMPSFTLLGEKVIRFPWILHSSYPHELLHNYWGNSVFVDYKSGNWCEGITAYMADHLIAEKRGLAGEYRRNTLQKYTDYVNQDNDFPISAFLSRSNSAEEAIGYGKCLMFNDMLRYKLGDDIFKKAYSKFYQDYIYTKASFDDIRQCFEEVSGENLEAFFNQWIKRTGAPTIVLSDVSAKEENGKYICHLTLSQTQEGELFDLLVPMVSYLEGESKVKVENLHLSQRETDFTFTFDSRPVKIEIDPQFNIFRRLDRNEVPTSISQLMGSKSGIIVLPKESEFLKEYEDLANMWSQIQQTQGKTLSIIHDSDLESLPTDKTAWVLGFDNKFSTNVQMPDPYLASFSDESKAAVSLATESGSLVYTLPNPANKSLTIGFLATNNQGAISSLSRKLLHYGKYGYLAFKGDEATNTLKGSFPILDSPLIYVFPYKENAPTTNAKLEARKALAY